MFEEFYDAGAEGYGRIFGRVPEHFRMTLLRLGRVATGQSIIDVATGTGIVAEAAVRAVGPSGTVLGVDISKGMLAVAERRLASFPNASLKVMNAQALDLSDESVDTVVSSLAVMLFPDPLQGLREMHRVLRPGGYASVCVLTTPLQSLTTRINDVIGWHVPSRAEAAAKYFSLGDPSLFRQMLEDAGFVEIEVCTESMQFSFSSFDAYFQPIEEGAGSVGAELASLPAEVRRAVREDIWKDVGSPADNIPIELEVTLLFGCGRKPAPIRAP